MSDLPSEDIEVSQVPEQPDAPGGVADALEAVVTGVPAPIRKNLTTALARLCTAATDWPATWLQGKAKELRAESDARVLLTETAAKQIAAQMKVDPEFALAASYKHAKKIVRQQVNLNKVGEQAVECFRLNPPPATEEPVADISEDWLNAFEEQASLMSSEQMQRLFGRILAGEIRKPSTYSIKTLKLMAQLDNRAASLFTLLCSLAISNPFPGMNVFSDVRVVSLGNAGSNSLQPYGLGFDSLNILHEYGLIISDYNSYMDYRMAIARDNQVLPLRYQNKLYGFVSKGEVPPIQNEFRVSGVAFTKSGRELLSIVDIEPNDAYTAALVAYFDKQGMTFRTV